MLTALLVSIFELKQNVKGWGYFFIIAYWHQQYLVAYLILCCLLDSKQITSKVPYKDRCTKGDKTDILGGSSGHSLVNN